MTLSNISRLLVAAPIALFASQALAQKWVAVGTTGIRVDKDSLRRGSDGLVYFTDNIGRDLNGVGVDEAVAMDCQRRLTYVLRFGRGKVSSDWRNRSRVIEPNSIEEAELQYVCANARHATVKARRPTAEKRGKP
ncbi:MAG: hypothetical protein ABIR51_04005 [Sphingomicrobium sp.]